LNQLKPDQIENISIEKIDSEKSKQLAIQKFVSKLSMDYLHWNKRICKKLKDAKINKQRRGNHADIMEAKKLCKEVMAEITEDQPHYNTCRLLYVIWREGLCGTQCLRKYASVLPNCSYWRV
jgi:hypothetical protein